MELLPGPFSKALAIDPSLRYFYLRRYLDNSFLETPPNERWVLIGIPADVSDPGRQCATVVLKANDEKWAWGVNVYEMRSDIWYQAFLWKGGIPPLGVLEPNPTDHQYCSERARLSETHPKEVKAKYTDNAFCMVQPYFIHLDTLLEAKVNPRAVTTTTILVKTSHYDNDTEKEEKQTIAIDEAYEQTASTSVTDMESWQVGTKVSATAKFKYPVAEIEFSLDVSFTYGKEHSETSAASDTHSYKISDSVEIVIPPKEKRYVSLVLMGDTDATADLDLEITVSGTSQGQRIKGTFWKNTLALLPGVHVIAIGDDSITYRVTSSVKASIVSMAYIVVTDVSFEDALLQYGNIDGMAEAGIWMRPAAVTEVPYLPPMEVPGRMAAVSL